MNIIIFFVIYVAVGTLLVVECRNNIRFRKTIIQDNTKEKDSDDDSERAAYYYQIDPTAYRKQQTSSILVPQNYLEQQHDNDYQQYLQQHLQQIKTKPKVQQQEATNIIYKPIAQPNLESILTHNKDHVQKTISYSPASEVSSFKYESPIVSYSNHGLISQSVPQHHQLEHRQHHQRYQAVLQQQQQQKQQQEQQQTEQKYEIQSPQVNLHSYHQQQHHHHQQQQQQQQQPVYYMISGLANEKLDGNSRSTLLAIPSNYLHTKHGNDQMIYLVQRPQLSNSKE